MSTELPSELETYVRDFGNVADQPADVVTRVVCPQCGSDRFWLQCSEEDGVAMRTCSGCKTAAFIGDSEDHWEDADTGDAVCPCKAKLFHLAIGFCLDPSGEINWMIVGAECTSCELVGVYADWCIDFEPNQHLLTQL